MVSVSVRDVFYQPMDEKIKTWTLRFPAKKNPNVEKLLFDWQIVLQYVVKAKYRLISRKFSGMKLFQPSVRLTTKNQARLYPFDKPIKSFYGAFSHDVTAPILVFQNNETAAMLVFQTNPVGVEFFSYVNAFFCSNKFA